MCYQQTAVVAILLLACAPDQPRPGSPTRESHRAGGVTELYGRPTSAAAMPFTSARRRPSGHRDPRWGGETEARGSGLSKTHHTPPPMTNVVAASEGTPHHLNVLLMAAQSQCTGKVRHRGGGGDRRTTAHRQPWAHSEHGQRPPHVHTWIQTVGGSGQRSSWLRKRHRIMSALVSYTALHS